MAGRSRKKALGKATMKRKDKGAAIADLLRQLKAAGAQVKNTRGDGSLSLDALQAQSQIAAGALKALGEPITNDFGAWVSWTKSF